MEQQLSDILDNLLGMLLLEGSYEIEEKEENFDVSIETKDAGRLIGARGESLDALQLMVNLMVAKKMGFFHPKDDKHPKDDQPLAGVPLDGKRVIIDVEGWRKQKEEELKRSAEAWGKEVLESGKELELEPQSPWQRRLIHMVISEMPGLSSESIGEGRDRHIVIKPAEKSELVSAQKTALASKSLA